MRKSHLKCKHVKSLGHDKSFAFDFVLSDTEMDKILHNKCSISPRLRARFFELLREATLKSFGLVLVLRLRTNQRMTKHKQTLITLHYS